MNLQVNNPPFVVPDEHKNAPLHQIFSKFEKSHTLNKREDDSAERRTRSRAVPDPLDKVELRLRSVVRSESFLLARLQKDDFVCVLDKTLHKFAALKFGDSVANWAAVGMHIYKILGFHAVADTPVDGYQVESDHARARVVPLLPVEGRANEWKVSGFEMEVPINHFIAPAKVTVVQSVREAARQSAPGNGVLARQSAPGNGVLDDDDDENNNDNDNNVSTASSTPRKRSSAAIMSPQRNLARLRLARAKEARAEADKARAAQEVAEVTASIRVALATSERKLQDLRDQEQALDAQIESLRARRGAVQAEIAKRARYCEELRQSLQGTSVLDLTD